MTPREALRAAAYEILEEGLFVFLEETESEPTEPIRFTMAIRHDGSPVSRIGIGSSTEVARMIAANFLGTDIADVGPDDERAATSEALNMLAGVVLFHVHGGQVELELCPPVAGGDPVGEVVTFHTDGGSIQLWYAE